MDMYQKRKMREEKKNNNQESLTKVGINWYPGHMQKTKRIIQEKLPLIDIVLELVDARIPYSSKIVDIDDLLKNKPKLLIMTKSDLCDLNETKKWIKYYEEKGYKVVLLNLKDNNDYKILLKEIENISLSIREKRENKDLIKKEIRTLVIGIPNVGKSTLINKLAGKKIAGVGNIPGFTKNVTWLKAKNNILLLDTPGILWPKFESEEVSLNLASTSAIKNEILPIDKVAIHILNKLDKYYHDILVSRYGIESVLNDELDITYDYIGHKIGAIISGNEVDYDRVSNRIINDIKNELIKKITFDRYDDYE